MKKIILILFIGILSFPIYAQNALTYEVNTAKSKVNWSGKKVVGGNTDGTIKITKGSLIMTKSKLSGGQFTLDTKTIASEKASSQLIDHLKNEDFFDVSKYPTASFVITAVEEVGKSTKITGKMTIKGVTKTISFPAQISYTATSVQAIAADVKIDRTQFGVQYGSGSIFSSLGDRAIEDNFTLRIAIVAEK